MSSEIESALESWLAEGLRQMGELLIRGKWELLHYQDAELADLRLFNTPQAAREISKYDDAGNFRPLKSAPSLPRGWKIVLPDDMRALREALDFFYPAMLGTLLAHQRGKLEIVPLRETLARQSGMYAVTKKITAESADALIGDFCRSDGKCLKTILWRIEPGVPVTSLPPEKFDPRANQLGTGGPAVPLLCAEACNFLVAAAREKVKSEVKVKSAE